MGFTLSVPALVLSLFLALFAEACADRPVSTYHPGPGRMICLPAIFRGHFATLCCRDEFQGKTCWVIE
jgi:hypothetical protein